MLWGVSTLEIRQERSNSVLVNGVPHCYQRRGQSCYVGEPFGVSAHCYRCGTRWMYVVVKTPEQANIGLCKW